MEEAGIDQKTMAAIDFAVQQNNCIESSGGATEVVERLEHMMYSEKLEFVCLA